MRTLPPLLTVLAIGGAIASSYLSAQTGPAAGAKGEARSPDLATDLDVLNRAEKQPAAVRDRYVAARSILDASRTATYADLAKDASFLELCDKENVAHLGGPMLGCVTSEGAKVWVRTVRPGKVEVHVEGIAKPFGPVATTAESDLSAVVTVTGLKPGTTARYSVLVDGKPIVAPKHAAIRVPSNDPAVKTRIAFGTCPHRWGLGNSQQANLIRSRHPAALLLYGDVAVQDRYNRLGLHRADYLMRDSFAAWRSLVAAVPVYAAWDDHDYFGDDLAGIPKGYTDADRRGVRDVFRTSWVNPGYGAKDEGIYYRTRIGPCDVIVLDTRYFRTAKKGAFLGEAQMQWLEEQLLGCKGPFVILSSGTMWSDYVSKGKDSWGAWDPQGRERIFQLIEKHRIPGVLLISGDRHGARGFRIPRASGYTFYEFEPASMGARYGPEISDPAWKDNQLFGFDRKYAFGEFEINPAGPDPEVTFRLIEESDKVLYSLTLKRSQLTPK